MNELPNIVRARLKVTPAGDHPDPDLLAAFAEQALAEQERSTVLAHISRCSGCREVLALAMPSTTALKTAASIDTASRRWFQGTTLRWAAAATCVVIVGSAVLMKRDLMMKQGAKTVALREDSISAEVADADKRNKTGNLATPQRAIPEEPVRNAETSLQQVLPSTPVPDTKKAFAAKPAAKPTMPAAPPVLAGRMRPEFANPRAGGVGGAFAAGSARDMSARAGANVWSPTPGPARNAVADAPTTGKDVSAIAGASKPAAQPTEVEVTAGALSLATDTAGSREKQELPGKAKPPSGTALYDALVSPPAQEQGGAILAKETARRAEMKRVETLRPPVARWTISSNGQLQHSVDSGKTWQAVVVAENATFRALSANGPDLWVGGASGLLYHSTDAGAHWTQVKPAVADATLTADIAAIEFIDVRQGKITTSTGEVWITTDGGQTWRKQP